MPQMFFTRSMTRGSRPSSLILSAVLRSVIAYSDFCLLPFTLPHAAHSAGIIFDRNLWISHVCDSRLARWHRLEQADVGDYGLDPLGTDDGTDDQSDREKENQT